MPKTPKNKPATTRKENSKKKLELLFEEYSPPKENHSKFTMKNIVKCIDYFQLGRAKTEDMRRFGEFLLTEKLKNFDIYKNEPINFDRRITALKFHPTVPYIAAMGSKSGTFVVRHLETYYKKEDHILWDGIGPGGSITDISFDPFTAHSVYTSSIDGTVQVRNYCTKTSKELLNTGSFEAWYCSVAASEPLGLVLAGDTRGNVKLLDKELKEVECFRLHRKKVNCLDFTKNCGWLLATASLDNTVKLWDVRMIKPNSPLCNLQHSDPVNSAYFSQTNGNRLLTTDQQNELRVYRGPTFDLETKILHPHRQFQHLTPIKATWHPLCDIIVVGRYPDPKWPSYLPKEPNSIDIISCETSSVEVQLTSPFASGLVSLNSFNCTGEILASAMGLNILYRKEKSPFEKNLNSVDNDNPSNLGPKHKENKPRQKKKCPDSKSKSKTSKTK